MGNVMCGIPLTVFLSIVTPVHITNNIISSSAVQRTHQRAESLRRVPTGDARRLHADAHVLLHELGFGLARVMLPHGAFVRAHERLAQVVLASGSRQHMHQQVEESRACTHGRHVTGRGFPKGKGPPWVQRWDVLTWNSSTGGQVKTSHNFATVMLSFTPRGKSQIYRKNVHVFCCYEVEGNSCKASLWLCVLFALRGQVLLLCVWTLS